MITKSTPRLTFFMIAFVRAALSSDATTCVAPRIR
jgi:hypothetical protein